MQMSYPENQGAAYGRVPGALGYSDTSGLNSVGGAPGPSGLTPLQTAMAPTINEPNPVVQHESFGIKLHRCSHPIADAGGMTVDEVRQGGIENCPLPALLAALVHTKKFETKIAIAEKKQEAISHSSKRGTEKSEIDLKVDRYFEVKFPGGELIQITDYFWGSSPCAKEYGHSKGKEALWVSLVEKAFVAQWASNSYNSLESADTAPDANTVVTALTGSVTVIEVGTQSNAQLEALAAAAETVPTIGRRTAGGVAHAWAILGFDKAKKIVKLYNALSGLRQERTTSNFKAEFDYLFTP